MELSTADSLVIVYEYKIEGMTCVACSGAIERGLTYEFKDKGLGFASGSGSGSGVRPPLLERNAHMQRQGARDDRPVRGREEGGQLLEHHTTQGAQLGTHLVGVGVGVGVGG